MIQGEKSYRLVEITLSSGKKIEATAEHPFYIKGKGWNPAGSLKVGQVLVLHHGTTVVVEEVDSRVQWVRVFNFSVANAHNYGGDGVLVHNADKPLGWGWEKNLPRRKQTGGDDTMKTERAARREAFRRYNIRTSIANNFTRKLVKNGKANVRGPYGEPDEIITATDIYGKEHEIDHHKWGHRFSAPP